MRDGGAQPTPDATPLINVELAHAVPHIAQPTALAAAVTVGSEPKSQRFAPWLRCGRYSDSKKSYIARTPKHGMP